MDNVNLHVIYTFCITEELQRIKWKLNIYSLVDTACYTSKFCTWKWDNSLQMSIIKATNDRVVFFFRSLSCAQLLSPVLVFELVVVACRKEHFGNINGRAMSVLRLLLLGSRRRDKFNAPKVVFCTLLCWPNRKKSRKNTTMKRFNRFYCEIFSAPKNFSQKGKKTETKWMQFLVCETHTSSNWANTEFAW